MPTHKFPSPPAATAASLLGILIAGGWAGPASAARCADFEAAGVPFYTCISDGPAGFRLSAGEQTSVGALRLEDENGQFLVLSMDYEEGDRVGAWTAATDFVVTLRWGSAGPHRDELAVEFCGPRPVPVRIRFQGPPEPRSCGQWTTLLDGLTYPDKVTERRRH